MLPTVFELPMAFSAWIMPSRVLESLGLDVDETRADAGFNGLRALGLAADEIRALNRRICGTQTVEGAPHLKTEHLPVFDCANRCGELGRRYIATGGHIRMMAAAQPFISGAISKTINLPTEADVDDIAAAYMLSWELGLKANALYRDGSKLSQPLSTHSDVDDLGVDDEDADDVEAALAEVSDQVAEVVVAVAAEPELVERVVERIIERPMRRRLPETRQSITHRFNVAGHEGYLTVGLYDDGAPGELFITMSKEGSTIGGLMDSLGTAISVALQYGVPIESLTKKFEHQRFEPMGMSTNPDIPFAKSLVDYIFRWMGMTFIPGYREQNAPQRTGSRADDTNDVKEDMAWADRTRTTTGTDAKNSPHEGHGPPPPGDRERIGGTAGDGPVIPSSAEASRRSIAGAVQTERTYDATRTRVLDHSNTQLQADAPACDVCGAITVRNGTCYRCLNCGNSMGCS
jgi:ribonucleoside-diphosphate reductase alpha chain